MNFARALDWIWCPVGVCTCCLVFLKVRQTPDQTGWPAWRHVGGPAFAIPSQLQRAVSAD